MASHNKHTLSAGFIIANTSDAVTISSGTLPDGTHAGQMSQDTQSGNPATHFHSKDMSC